MYARQSLTKDQARQKIQAFCAYQERCHTEVKEKLYTYGLHKNEVDDLLSNLIENNYLNEERFAVHFAGGKFRMKQWGRKKIEFELRKKKVSAYCIKAALKELKDPDYLLTLKKLAGKKWAEVKSGSHLTRMAKTTNYLLQKGFEAELVRNVVAECAG